MFGYYADLEEVLDAALEAADQEIESSNETPSDIDLT